MIVDFVCVWQVGRQQVGVVRNNSACLHWNSSSVPPDVFVSGYWQYLVRNSCRNCVYTSFTANNYSLSVCVFILKRNLEHWLRVHVANCPRCHFATMYHATRKRFIMVHWVFFCFIFKQCKKFLEFSTVIERLGPGVLKFCEFNLARKVLQFCLLNQFVINTWIFV